MNLAGLDVGGTFTDLILMGEATGQVRIAKVPTTVRNQAEGVLAALREAGIAAAAIKVLVHGTPTATNALLERKGATAGLITTLSLRVVPWGETPDRTTATWCTEWLRVRRQGTRCARNDARRSERIGDPPGTDV
jgi:hypothetical protein